MSKMLEFINLSRHFERNNYLLKASGYVDTGEILAVRGASGSGKSTLLKMLVRLLLPDKGEIFYKSEDYHRISPQDWRREIQYLSQKPVVFDGSVEDNFRLPFTLNSIQIKRNYSSKQVLKYMDALGLSEELLNQNAGTLSGGEAARVALIRSLLLQPSILLLDEPTAYLDELSANQVLHLLETWRYEESDRAIMVVSHKQDEISGLSGVRFLDL